LTKENRNTAKKPKATPIKLPGSIDIVSLFQAEALDLIGAINRGRLLHGTRNIRDSGAPLEKRLREFFQARLPFQFQVVQGYFFDIKSRCTPQIDLMVVNAADRHELMVSEEGVSYLPFTSALAVMEVKNSARDVDGNLNQLAAIVDSINEMQSDLHRRRPQGGTMLPEIISVLFFGESKDSKLEDFKGWYASHPHSVPTFTVLLDRGVIITKIGALNHFFEPDGVPSVDFYDHRNGRELFLCTPEIMDDKKMGRALLWLYFALVAHTNLSEGNKGNILSFSNDVMDSYKLCAVKALDQVADWNAWETMTF
jgi:hypothetical protein